MCRVFFNLLKFFKLDMIKIKQLIKDLGGPTAVAKACRVHRTTVHNWLRENKCTPKLISPDFR